MKAVVPGLVSRAKKRHNDTERLYSKVQSYTTLCINILVLSEAIFISYFLPVLWFNVYFHYDHITVVFTDDWLIGVVLITMAVFLLVTTLYAKLFRSKVVKAAYAPCTESTTCDCFAKKIKLTKQVRRLTFLMIIIESWNIFTIVGPIYAANHFLSVSRPSGNYFVGIFVRDELKSTMHQIIVNTMGLIRSISVLGATTSVQVEDDSKCDDGRKCDDNPSEFEAILFGIFKPTAITPVFALVQVFVLTILYCLIFTHTAYIRCIYYAARYQRNLQSEIRTCKGNGSSQQIAISDQYGHMAANLL